MMNESFPIFLLFFVQIVYYNINILSFIHSFYNQGKGKHKNITIYDLKCPDSHYQYRYAYIILSSHSTILVIHI